MFILYYLKKDLMQNNQSIFLMIDLYDIEMHYKASLI